MRYLDFFGMSSSSSSSSPGPLTPVLPATVPAVSGSKRSTVESLDPLPNSKRVNINLVDQPPPFGNRSVTDITFKARDGEIRYSKWALLKTKSSFFIALLNGDPKIKIIDTPEVGQEALELLFLFLESALSPSRNICLSVELEAYNCAFKWELTDAQKYFGPILALQSPMNYAILTALRVAKDTINYDNALIAFIRQEWRVPDAEAKLWEVQEILRDVVCLVKKEYTLMSSEFVTLYSAIRPLISEVKRMEQQIYRCDKTISTQLSASLNSSSKALLASRVCEISIAE